MQTVGDLVQKWNCEDGNFPVQVVPTGIALGANEARYPALLDAALAATQYDAIVICDSLVGQIDLASAAKQRTGKANTPVLSVSGDTQHCADLLLAGFIGKASSKVLASTPVDGAMALGANLANFHGRYMELMGGFDSLLAPLYTMRAKSLGTEFNRGHSISFGLTLDTDGVPRIRTSDALDPSLLPAFNSAIAETLKEACANLRWNAVQFNVGTYTAWHVDENALGYIGIGAVGNFTGGELEIEGERPVVIKDRLLIFDAQSKHRARVHVGSRISFVLYQHFMRDRADRGQRGFLKSLGFGLDDCRAWKDPVRAELNVGDARSGKAMYIGRKGHPT